MSDAPLELPDRASLEQLRKQAKERRNAAPGTTLADAQFALAREYGFDSWPKLVRHVEAIATPGIAQHEGMARDMVAAYRDRDEAAAARLNELFHSAFTLDQIRDFLRDRLFHLPDGGARIAAFDIGSARLLVAGLFGFGEWDALIGSSVRPAANSAGISSTPPFHHVDEATGVVSVRQPMSPRDWETLIAIMRERGLTGLDANNMLDDAAMARLAALDGLTLLRMHGSDRVTDDGCAHLARMAALEAIDFGGWKSPLSDKGFAALRGLPRLRRVGSWWSRRLTDAGAAATLATCPAIEDADFGGTALGDALIAALAGKPNVRRVFAGDGVTDAGLSRLRDIPRFAQWRGGERKYALLEFDAGPTYAAIKGPFTGAGLRALGALDGLFALNVHWTSSAASGADLAHLAAMPNLGVLAIDGDLCDDEAMRQIGTLPRLRMLLAQEPAAGDEGFAALSASRTLEYMWGRECPRLTGRGFAALADIPSLQGIALSLKSVDDGALAMLPRFPSLRAIMPMDVEDEGFRHIGRCPRLEDLWCMYCRHTGDAATEHVAGLRLKTYYAGATKMTDRSLELLARMPTLERIELHACHRIGDAGVRALAALPALRELSVEGCRNVTRAAAAGFSPAVRVKYSAI